MEAVILGVAVLAGLACPVHMWWSHRRGKAASCCPPMSERTTPVEDAESLRARRAEIEARLAELEVTEAREPVGRTYYS